MKDNLSDMFFKSTVVIFVATFVLYCIADLIFDFNSFLSKNFIFCSWFFIFSVLEIICAFTFYYKSKFTFKTVIPLKDVIKSKKLKKYYGGKGVFKIYSFLGEFCTIEITNNKIKVVYNSVNKMDEGDQKSISFVNEELNDFIEKIFKPSHV